MSPQQILDRMGLAPGASLAAQFVAPMQRDLDYGILGNQLPFPSQLVAHLSSHVDHTGADVCIAAGAPFTGKLQIMHHSAQAGGRGKSCFALVGGSTPT